MAIELYLTFLAAVVLLALTPGPAMALLISNSVSFGLQAGVRTLFGNLIGLTILVCCIVFGLTSIVHFMAEWFDWVKYAGAAYLIWLGFMKIWGVGVEPDEGVPEVKNRRFIMHGLFVAIGNPKVLLFLAAFLPQFLSPLHDIQVQLMVYGASFVAVIAVVDLVYVLAAGKTKTFLSRQKLAVFDKVSGVLLMCGGVWLIFARRQ